MVEPAGAILESYRNHPLRAETILARVMRGKGKLEGLRELDLAVDPETEITDQNHVGGLELTLELAQKAGVRSASLVLDSGSGLGGSARVLADTFACNVIAVESHPGRHEDAVRLTSLISLRGVVELVKDDLLHFMPTSEELDIIWSQAAWNHISGRRHLIAACARMLRPGGTIAFEDATLLRVPKDAGEAAKQKALSLLWHAEMITAQEWLDLMADEGFEIRFCEDLSKRQQDYYLRRIEIANANTLPQAVPESELQAWQDAVSLAAAGILGYTRIVAQKPS